MKQVLSTFAVELGAIRSFERDTVPSQALDRHRQPILEEDPPGECNSP